eukprot:gnl/TRDRNA2_/TRDRNA2_169037_c1_seq2.p1 gnl/TRDRNA2_/TRDRNA2_169037_c1~~gnl/TRDRNA2_/TRDRNA2_169037_c1_seq2.p1  ORF type:complete len:318 (+),score=51.71 gnl/TRDRNA2_/TRDRNA2_169037_c1_seq2:613-1566(+)
MQIALDLAGRMETAITKAVRHQAGKLWVLQGSASAISDFTKPSELTQAEKLMEEMEAEIAWGVGEARRLDYFIKLGTGGDEQEAAAEQYYPIMYFVDEKKMELPSTCVGHVISEPIVGNSMDACASACDAAENSQGCVGFSYFQVGPNPPLCFLMSKFKSVAYYSGCSFREPNLDPFADLRGLEQDYNSREAPFYRNDVHNPEYQGEPSYEDVNKRPVFLQKNAKKPLRHGPSYYEDLGPPQSKKPAVVKKHGIPKSLGRLLSDVGKDKVQHEKMKRPDVTCFAKFSTFSGTTLKPDRSGKCKQCLKKVQAIDRCYE